MLLFIYLNGGADGLNMLVPNDPRYTEARPTLGLRGDQVTPIDPRFGLNNAAPGLIQLWREGRLALVPASGFRGQTRSHFSSQVVLDTGAGDVSTGWLARHLNTTQRSTGAFRGVHVGSTALPRVLTGSGQALATTDIDGVRLGTYVSMTGEYHFLPSVRTAPHRDASTPGMLSLGWTPTSGPGFVPIRTAGGAVARAGQLKPSTINPAPFGTDANVAPHFVAAARVIEADLGTEVVSIMLGGWDTHSNQTVPFSRNLAALDQGITAIRSYAASRRVPLTVMVVTEFGRRVAENQAGGTDHGKGFLTIVAGDRVSGGIKGTWPGLGSLDDGDVPVTNNVRAVQHELAARVLGSAQPDRVVSGVSTSDWLGVTTAA